MIWLQYLLPQHWLSKLMFRFARIENTWLKNTFTRWFVKTYQVDLSEAQREKIEDYKTFNDFFTRRLKSGARVIAKCSIVCPVDGAVSQVGAINDAQIVQAKNHHYSVAHQNKPTNAKLSFKITHHTLIASKQTISTLHSFLID
jgi:phosphatidylserine decarboxylase